jgi:hypothetical protein
MISTPQLFHDTTEIQGWEYSSVVKHLSSTFEALGSIPSTREETKCKQTKFRPSTYLLSSVHMQMCKHCFLMYLARYSPSVLGKKDKQTARVNPFPKFKV